MTLFFALSHSQAHRIAKHQEIGGNAWRTAHNAPTEVRAPRERTPQLAVKDTLTGLRASYGWFLILAS